MRLKPYRQMFLKQQKDNKLEPMYYAPYKVSQRIEIMVSQRIEIMAYRLEFPPSSRVHVVYNHPIPHLPNFTSSPGKHELRVTMTMS